MDCGFLMLYFRIKEDIFDNLIWWKTSTLQKPKGVFLKFLRRITLSKPLLSRRTLSLIVINSLVILLAAVKYQLISRLMVQHRIKMGTISTFKTIFRASKKMICQPRLLQPLDTVHLTRKSPRYSTGATFPSHFQRD